MEKLVFAKINNLRKPARKVRIVADMVRGMNVERALDVLKYTARTAADDVYKAVSSALANAKAASNISASDLVISQIFVNEAPTYKRGRAVSRGRSHRILKRNSHLTVGLGVQDKVKSDAAKPKTAKKSSSKEAK